MLVPDWLKALALVVLLGLAFAVGWLVRGWRSDAIQSRAVATQAGKQVVSVHRQDAVTAKIDASATAQAEKTRIVYRTIHAGLDRATGYLGVLVADGRPCQIASGAGCLVDTHWHTRHGVVIPVPETPRHH